MVSFDLLPHFDLRDLETLLLLLYFITSAGNVASMIGCEQGLVRRAVFTRRIL